MKICCIYKITSPVGRIYIGQTINFNHRIKKYKTLNCKQQPKLYNSFVKYGFDNHKIEILENCEKNQLNEKEVLYIKQFNCFDTENGLNLNSGGNVREFSKESIEKIKASTKKYVAENGNHCLGKKASPESKEKMRKSRLAYIAKHGNYKIVMTESHKKNMSIARKKYLANKLSNV